MGSAVHAASAVRSARTSARRSTSALSIQRLESALGRNIDSALSRNIDSAFVRKTDSALGRNLDSAVGRNLDSALSRHPEASFDEDDEDEALGIIVEHNLYEEVILEEDEGKLIFLLTFLYIVNLCITL